MIPEQLVPADDADRISREFRFEVITPMFGGDAKSWQLDKEHPVRVQSIKGQLRFWWRTMQHETDHDTLLFRENAIWGGVAGKDDDDRLKSPVSLGLRVTRHPRWQQFVLEPAGYAVKGDIIPKYVSFPVTDRVKKNESIQFVLSMEFALTISYQRTYEQEVMDTLRLWTLFGGVGARTRRGTGSLSCEELLTGFNTAADIASFVSRFGMGTSPLSYPTLAGAQVFAGDSRDGRKDDDIRSEWKVLLEKYGSFRQQRTPGQPKPGRSYWPEPDAIRLITKKSAKHQPAHPDKIWFPRAVFGLPIISRFQDPKGTGDPDGQYSLEPDIGSGMRLPSPVIIKMVALAGKKICPMVIQLGQKFPEKLQLKGPGGPYQVSPNSLPQHSQGKVMVTKDPLNGRTIVGALADYLGLNKLEGG